MIERFRMGDGVVSELLLDVVIPGQPVAKGRPRVGRNGAVYTPERTRDWESYAATMARCARLVHTSHGPYRVVVNAVAQRPKKLDRKKDPDHRLWRAAKPDGDNVLKAVCDALQMAGVVRDDSQIVRKTVSSLYAARGEEAHVHVRLYRAGELCG